MGTAKERKGALKAETEREKYGHLRLRRGKEII